MKKSLKCGLFILLIAGAANAGSITSSFTNEPSAGKQPLSAAVKKTPKPFKSTAPFLSEV